MKPHYSNTNNPIDFPKSKNKMNERIRQLAEQAGIEFVYDPTETPMRAFVECWEDDLEKFAELIVRECASRVDNILREKKDGGGTMGDEIREHFGVEE